MTTTNPPMTATWWTDEAPAQLVRCGNRAVHGSEVTHHASVAEVQACHFPTSEYDEDSYAEDRAEALAEDRAAEAEAGAWGEGLR